LPDLLVERANGVVHATLNRPERKNALNFALFDELRALFDEVDRNEADRALVLTGAGGEFSSGADLSSRNDGDPVVGSAESIARIHECAIALHRCSTPTVAAVDGLAVGAGMSLALGCDLVVASSRARFSAIFVRRGLSIDFGLSWLLPRLVGLSKAKELALLGEFVDASEALSLGLVARVVDPDELDATARSLAGRLATGPTVALRGDLELLDGSSARTFEEAIAQEASNQAHVVTTEDVAEAVAAFLEKRDARFTGR
jgi:enoyl-CoA hydratase/carnithine racemase